MVILSSHFSHPPSGGNCPAPEPPMKIACLAAAAFFPANVIIHRIAGLLDGDFVQPLLPSSIRRKLPCAGTPDDDRLSGRRCLLSGKRHNTPHRRTARW